MSDSGNAIKRPSVAALYAFVAVLLALMFVFEPEIRVDPNTPVREFPIAVELPTCGE